jgi:Glycosyl transferase family 2.
MTLELLICTIDDGINNVANMLLPPSTHILYLISWQHSLNIPRISLPPQLNRPDVRVFELEGRGLSRNRNNALNNASGDICLISDDDCAYQEKSLNHIIEIFETHPSIDLATFRMASTSNAKSYPSYSFDLRHYPKNYYISSIEIAFRRSSVQGKLQFNELFGLGAPILQSGEEEVFILDALSNNLHCQFFPYVIVRHDHPTTGSTKAACRGTLMARGAYLYLAYRSNMFLRAIVIAKRVSSKENINFFFALSHILKGINYIKKNLV